MMRAFSSHVAWEGVAMLAGSRPEFLFLLFLFTRTGGNGNHLVKTDRNVQKEEAPIRQA
jgi:hypothetical protein